MRLWNVKLYIQNTSVWANARSPPAWGEKVTCWWAIAQIFTGQIQGCRLFHYLPVSQPVIWSEVLGWECARWKENKMPFDPAAPCYSSVKRHYPDNPDQNNISHGVSKPNIQTFNAQSTILMHRQKSLDKLTEQTRHPCQVHFSFCFLPCSFFFRHVSYSQQYKDFQIQPTAFVLRRVLWSSNYDLHAMLHCWQLYCFMFDILTLRREWDYPAVMWQREENNAGTFTNCQEDEFTSLL